MRALLAALLTAATLSIVGAARAEPTGHGSVPALKLNASHGWRLEAVISVGRDEWSLSDDDAIIVKGHVINDSDRERPTPVLRFAVADAAAKEIYSWTVKADEERAKPHARVPFSARLESPPPEVASLEIRTVERR